MKIYDISKGYFTAPVYPGDPVPRLERLQQMQLGDKFNLTAYYGYPYGCAPAFCGRRRDHRPGSS